MGNHTVDGEQKVEAGESIHDLTRAFELFSQKISRLEKAYHTLQKRFASVNLELESTNHYLGNILGNMTQGLLFIEPSGTIRTLNCAAEGMLGCSKKTAVGFAVDTLLADDAFGFSIREALETRTAPEWSTITQENGCEQRHLEVTATYIEGDREEDAGLLLLLRDVTELKQWKRIADRSDRLKELGEMAASVAHEIRNPLGGIKGFAALLVRDLEEMPESQKMAGYIVDGAEALNRLVTNILHYSRPLEIQLKPTDIAALVEDCALLLSMDSATHPQLVIEQEVETTPFVVPVDREALKGALLNLMINANQAMAEGGRLTLRLTFADGGMRLEVEDEGVGIAKEIQEKIFSPFFTTKHEGSGFGLSEVYRVVQGHGGSVEVESEPGSGSTFIIKIPIAG